MNSWNFDKITKLTYVTEFKCNESNHNFKQSCSFLPKYEILSSKLNVITNQYSDHSNYATTGDRLNRNTTLSLI